MPFSVPPYQSVANNFDDFCPLPAGIVSIIGITSVHFLKHLDLSVQNINTVMRIHGFTQKVVSRNFLCVKQ